jgi:hypothetical protein
MDNPETQATLKTQDEEKTTTKQNTHTEHYKDE